MIQTADGLRRIPVREVTHQPKLKLPFDLPKIPDTGYGRTRLINTVGILSIGLLATAVWGGRSTPQTAPQDHARYTDLTHVVGANCRQTLHGYTADLYTDTSALAANETATVLVYDTKKSSPAHKFLLADVEIHASDTMQTKLLKSFTPHQAAEDPEIEVYGREISVVEAIQGKNAPLRMKLNRDAATGQSDCLRETPNLSFLNHPLG